jgi:hypothetical protein
MTFRGTLILWALVIGLGAYVWTTGGPPDDTRKTAVPPAAPGTAPILPFDPRDVEGLEIWDAGRILRLERRGNAWEDGSGQPWTDVGVLTGLIDTLAALRPLTQVTSGPASLGDYGLAPPARWVGVRLTGRPLVRLELGASNPAGTAVYARRPPPADTGILLVGSIVQWEIDKVLRAAVPKH